jgi:3-(3-hydroxy-phenyl)propionate hydroxylase
VNDFHAPVGIVGAGPVGLSCALRLAAFGIRSMIVEAEPGLKPLGSKACLIQGDVVEILHRVGCGKQLAAEGVTWNVARTYVRGKEIGKTVHPVPVGFGPFINISQYRIEQVLLDRLRKTPEAGMLWSHRVTGLVQEQEGVTVFAGGRALRFRYLVACDGVRSTLRTLTGVEWHGRTYPDLFLITDIKAELPVARERHFHYDPPFNPGRQLVMHAQPDNVWRIDWQLPPDVDIDEEQRSGALDKRVRDVIGDVDYEIKWLSTYRFHQRVVQRFRIGDVFFAGDAAHALPPYGARGMNSGIQDADNLAWKLAEVLNGRADPGLLDTYHLERFAAARENLRITGATIQFMQPPSALRRWIRRFLLATAHSFGMLRGRVNSGRMAEPYVYTDSPIIDRSELAGRYVPDCVVWKDNARTRLRELLPDGFALLCFGMSAPAPGAVVLTDQEAPGRAAAGYRAGHWYLVRPDGHIAGSGPASRIGDADALLRRVSRCSATVQGENAHDHETTFRLAGRIPGPVGRVRTTRPRPRRLLGRQRLRGHPRLPFPRRSQAEPLPFRRPPGPAAPLDEVRADGRQLLRRGDQGRLR